MWVVALLLRELVDQSGDQKSNLEEVTSQQSSKGDGLGLLVDKSLAQD